MKVEKITIQKELLEIPDNQQTIDFNIIPPMAIHTFLEKGEIPSNDITVQRVTYRVQRVWNYEKGYSNFLVRLDDRELFDDLLKIQNDILDSIVKEKTKHLNDLVLLARKQAIEGIENARIDVWRSFRSKSLWKKIRLIFNQ